MNCSCFASLASSVCFESSSTEHEGGSEDFSPDFAVCWRLLSLRRLLLSTTHQSPKVLVVGERTPPRADNCPAGLGATAEHFLHCSRQLQFPVVPQLVHSQSEPPLRHGGAMDAAPSLPKLPL